MTPCGFCGGPRLNGTPMKKDAEGDGWRPYNGTVNPAAANTKLACRSCARERMGLDVDPNHEI